MIKGDAGQNISKFASSSTDASQISTSLPYISYIDLAGWLDTMYQHSLLAVDSYFTSNGSDTATPAGFKSFCAQSSAYSDVFICDGYRLCRSAKLLMSLGYGNFVAAIQYDVFAMAFQYSKEHTWSLSGFKASEYNLNFTMFESLILNSPNLSILPLLAYHKICNDHYRNEKWQPFEPWTCNIDYLSPTDNMDSKSFVDASQFTSLITSLIDLENSNLPIDYFTSVLPRAQYGSQSAVPIGATDSTVTLRLSDPADKSIVS